MMKIDLRLGVLFLLLSSAVAFGKTVPFSGVVVDDKNVPVVAGNIVLYTSPDTIFISGSAVTEGAFAFDADLGNNDSLLLRVSAMGFNTKWITLIAPYRETMTLDTIRMETSSLNEVEIRAFAPVVQNKGSKLVVDVENTSLSAMGTAYEVLENTPGLTVGTDGSVTVFGRGTAIIYLDGQRIPAEMLRSIPSIQISSVEILKNPPASYDAQGRCVVNIITKKRAMEGYNVDLFQAGTYTNAFGDATIRNPFYGYTGINGYWRKNRWTITGRSGMFLGNRWENTLYLRSFDEDSVHYTMRNEINEARHMPAGGYPGLTFQYRPDSLSHIDLSANFSFFRHEKDVNNSNIIMADSVETVIATTRHDQNRNFDAMYILGYSRTLDTLGSELYASVSYTDYRNRSLGDISQDVATPAQSMNSSLRNNSLNTIRFGVAQVSWTKYLDTAWKIETGTKFTQVINGSEVGLQRYASGEWIDDSTLLNAYEYREQTAALYAQFTYGTEKFMATAGVRGEYSLTKGKSLLYNEELIDTNYLNVFPMAQMTYEIIEDLAVELDYSWSLERPDFEDLDPSIMYIDSLSYMIGNPALKPEYTHEFSAELIYLEAASIGFDYAYTAQGMEMYVERTGPNNSQFVAQTRNFNYVKQYSIDLAIPYQTKWWTTYNTISYSRTISHYDENGDYAHINGDGWFFFMYDKFSYKQFSLEAMYWYSTGQPEGLFVARPMSSLRFALMYKTKDNALTARLIFNDVLYSSYVQADSRIPGFDLYYKEAGDSRFVRVAVSYRFGKVKQQDLNDRRNNESERNRIKG